MMSLNNSLNLVFRYPGKLAREVSEEKLWQKVHRTLKSERGWEEGMWLVSVDCCVVLNCGLFFSGALL